MLSGLSHPVGDQPVALREAQAMRRVAPSTIVREEIGELLAGGVAPETNILSALAELGVRYVVQQGLSRSRPIAWAAAATSAVPGEGVGATATRTRPFAPPR